MKRKKLFSGLLFLLLAVMMLMPVSHVKIFMGES